MTIYVGHHSIDLDNLLLEGLSTYDLGNYASIVLSFIRDWKNGVEEIQVNTSGSTGQPQELTVKRNDLVRSAHRTNTYFRLTSMDDVALLCLDIRHIAGMMMVIRALEADMDLIVIEPTSSPLSELGQTHQPTFAAMVPLQLQTSIEGLSLDTTPIRTLLVGGAPIDPQLEQSARNVKPAVYHTFGMTETLSHFAVRKLSGSGTSDHYELLDGWHIRVNDEGQLQVKEEESEEWLTTKDEVEIIDSSSFRWLGRTDNVINTGGVKVFPERVELAVSQTMRALAVSGRFFCTGEADHRLGQAIVLIYEGKMEEALEIRLLAELKKNLPKYHAPRKIICLEHFSQTANGKIQRNETLASYLNR